ncbi:MAG TPA: hypothetical protein VK177_21860 [Flavobacteriales bacterium]|nr:hypothetical protein [Flavobacteriales bacterium]
MRPLYLFFPFVTFLCSCEKETLEPSPVNEGIEKIKVVDRETQLPLEGVNVTLIAGYMGATKIIVTNSNGYAWTNGFKFSQVKLEKTEFLTDWYGAPGSYFEMQKPAFLNVHIKDTGYVNFITVIYRPEGPVGWPIAEYWPTGTDTLLHREVDPRVGKITGNFNSTNHLFYFSATGGQDVALEILH